MTKAKSGSITVLLADDHSVVREGYRRLLEQHDHITVIGELLMPTARWPAFAV
jgi:DNA-binding NarL/FixJ family response regulator